MEHAGVVRIPVQRESELAGELEHLVVGSKDETLHRRHSSRLRCIDQRQHEDAGDAATLPRIVDGHGKFAAVARGVGNVARDADLQVLSIALHHRHQGQVPHVIDLGEVFQLAGRQFLQGGHEALVARVRRQMLDELLLHGRVLSPYRADRDLAAIKQITGANEIGRVVAHEDQSGAASDTFGAR